MNNSTVKINIKPRTLDYYKPNYRKANSNKRIILITSPNRNIKKEITK